MSVQPSSAKRALKNKKKNSSKSLEGMLLDRVAKESAINFPPFFALMTVLLEVKFLLIK